MRRQNDILDDELATPSKKATNDMVWFWALIFTFISAILYLLPLLIIFPDFEEKASPLNEFLSGLLSFLHLIIAMVMMDSFTRQNYKKVLKGGYYILLFGSGVFFVGAVLSMAGFVPEGLPIPSCEVGEEYSFWDENYEAIIILLIIFLKALSIKPIARFLSKK